MAAVCLGAGVVALVAAASMGAGRPFRRYLLVGLLLALPLLLAGRPLVRLLGANFTAFVAGTALVVLAWSAVGARWHARGTPNLLASARRLSRLGSRLVLIGSGLALAALIMGMRG